MAKIKVSNVLFNILTIVTLIAVVFVAFNLITGTKGYAVTSQSMEDTLNRGYVVFSRKVDFNKLEVGDVVTVKVGNSGYFTHRIVDIDFEKSTIKTRGDANPSDDPMLSQKENIVGKMWYSVPLLGFLSIAFAGISTTKILIILAIIAMALVVVNMILTRKKRKVRGDKSEQK